MSKKPTPKLKKKGSPAKEVERAASLDLEKDLEEIDQKTKEPTGEGRRSRLTGFFRDSSPSAMKEALKRPLSGLLRRSASRERAQPSPARGDDEKPLKKTGWAEEGPSGRGASSAGPRPAPRARGRSPSITTSMDVDGVIDGTVMDGAMMEIGDSPGDGARRPDSSPGPRIPRLEEASGPAQAPSVAVNKVASFKELDGELARHAAFATLEGLDLGLLTRFLAPEAETREEETPWTWDYLFTAVSGELRSDKAEEVGGEA